MSNETLICLVRHGVTDWNYEGRAQGRSDVPLNQEGIQQAEAAARRLAGERWDAIYSSPLKRAFATAEAVARRCGMTVQPDPGLMERDMAAAESTTEPVRRIRWPGKLLKEVPGVETDAQLRERAHRTLTAIALRHPGKRVLCVAHGGLLKAFLESIVKPDGNNPQQFFLGNTSIAWVGFNGERWRLVSPPDNSHLLVNGVEFTGENWRIRLKGMDALAAMTGLPADKLDAAIFRASAVESAWEGDRLVAFARMFTDYTLVGYVDIAVADPLHAHLIPDLLDRFRRRFPEVTLTRLPMPRVGA